MLRSLDISASGLTVQRHRMDVIAANLANVSTTRDAAGRPNPYRRQMALIQAAAVRGAPEAVAPRPAGTVGDPTPFRLAFEPHHPDADEQGYVRYPNVDLMTETVDALAAARAYEANLAAIEATKSMIAAALRIIA